MRWRPILLLALALSACSGPASKAAGAPVGVIPALSAPQAAAVVTRADDIRRAALAGGDAAGLAPAFGRVALQALRRHVARELAVRERLRERPLDRHLVHFAPTPDGAEAVLLVRAIDQVETAAVPSREAVTLRQWWVLLQWSGAAWQVVQERDLAPPQWWPDAGSGS